MSGYDYSKDLNPEKALIFRITHLDNLPWILEQGLICRSGAPHDPGFRRIGSSDLIAKRANRAVPLQPHGTLADYVPFYFTPFSPMLRNISTGYHGIERIPNNNIVILVSSLPEIRRCGLTFLFTDRHAYLQTAQYFDSLEQLGALDWPALQRRDFRRDIENPDKFDRYQAEALIHNQVPVEALLGVVCHNPTVSEAVERQAQRLQRTLKVIARPRWYF